MTRRRMMLFVGSFTVLTSCTLPLPGAEGDGVVEPPHWTIAAPCELVDRIDTSNVVVRSDATIGVSCEESQYSHPVPGRTTVGIFPYVDYVDDAGGHGLRDKLTIGLQQVGLGPEDLIVLGLFCDDTIEAGFREWEPEIYDLNRVEVEC